MTTYTINELATETLATPGLIGVDETPSAAELADAVKVCKSEILQMNARGIPIWNGSELEVPEEYFTLLAQRCALALFPKYGGMSLSDAVLAMAAAERNLRALGTVRGTGVVQKAEYF